MCNSTRRWLVGPALALIVLSAAARLYAQSPGPPPPPPAASPSGAGGLARPAPPDAGESPNFSSSRSDMIVQKQGDLLRFGRNVPGDSKPIVIDADEIHTWDEGGKVVLLLKGQVLVQQSVTQTRFNQGVVWIDLKRYRDTGILHVDLYAEDNVRLDVTLESQEARRAVLDLNTRGEFRLRAHKGKVIRQSMAADPLVNRARGLGVGPKFIQASVPPAPASPKSNVQPATTLPPAAPKQPEVVTPPRLVPAPKASPPASMGGPQAMSSDAPPGRPGPAAEFVLAQHTEPAAPDATGSRPVPAPRPTPDGLNDPARPVPGRLPPPPDDGGVPPLKPIPPGDDSNNPEPRRSSRQSGPPDPAPPGGEGTGPTIPPVPPPSEPAAPPGPPPLPPSSKPRQYRILPRSGENFNLKRDEERINGVPTGRQVITVTGGVILNVKNVPRLGNLDVEADRAVIWTKGHDAEGTANAIQSEKGASSSELEFYMAGHVTVRVQGLNGKEKSVLETEEIYYDTNRNVAVALNARLQTTTTRVPNTEPLVLVTRELFQTGEDTFEFADAEVFSSKLLSDPGLKLILKEGTLENRTRPRTNLFGQPMFDRKTGKPLLVQESILEAKNVISELEGVPFFYTPYLITDARDPMGPVQSIHIGANRIFGFQTGVSLDVYKLLSVQKYDGTRWRLYLDYLSRRGPAAGTTFTYLNKLYPDADPFDLDSRPGFYQGQVVLYGLQDKGTDILGGQPPQLFTFNPPGNRGRATWWNQVRDLPGGFDVVSQVFLLSDRNFLEEYYKREYDTAPNFANFAYVKQQQDNWAWTALGQARTSPWITTTEWLPRADGYLLGQDFYLGQLGFTSNTQVSAGYAQLRPSNDPTLFVQNVPGGLQIPNSALFPTTRRDNTGRAFVFEELSLPLDAGPFKVVPYAKGTLSEYTRDLAGDETGRVWGGAGVRASIPFTRLYPDVCSELFNVNGINHKIVASGNYFIARTNEPFTRLPQLDRLNDDSTDQTLRTLKPYEPLFNTQSGLALALNPLFDPQLYAIRRLVDNRIDTQDNIQVFQFDLRQRLQTKRGFPGAEHVVDWMMLDTSVSIFPEANKNNFGKPFSFLEYNYVWNVGDQTAIESTGLYDPQEKGPRIYTVGLFFNRPDRTAFYLGYRQIDPLQSRLVTASASYVFSPKYSATFTASYDFGVSESVSNSVLFTRTGTDLQVTLGFTYNTLQNNFGAIIEIVPTLVPLRGGSGNLLAQGAMGR